jgi:AcrR family transcriptional regulator
VRLPGKADVHDDIVQATIELGQELGEEGLTMRAIAARLDVSSTVLYQHFESKAAILHEIRLRAIRALTETLSSASGNTPVEQIAAMAERYVDYARDNPWLYRLLFANDPVAWSSIHGAEREELLGPLTIVRDTIGRATRSGALPSTLNVEHTALMLWASMHGLAAMLLDGRISDTHPIFPVQDVSAFVRGYIEGIARGLELPPHEA